MPKKTLFDLVKDHVRRTRGRRARAWVVHRLDQDASGLLVFAVSERAYDRLKDDMRARRVHRIYLALVQGEFEAGPDSAGTVQAMLRESRDGFVEALPADARTTEHAQHAVTHYRVEAQRDGLALVRVRLETGRKHQIRAHMAFIGRTIAGDRRYGSEINPLRRLGLHAVELGMRHPGTGEPLRFTSQAPPAFYDLVGKTPPPTLSRPAPRAPQAHDTSWQRVADWYDDYQKTDRSDHFADVIMPGAMALLGEGLAGRRVLDVACGEGAFAAMLDSRGAHVLGIDAAPALVEAAAARGLRHAAFLTHDARSLDSIDHRAAAAPFDDAVCVMALMNIDPLGVTIDGIARRLRPLGRFVAVILHPAFRSPKRTSWGWDGRHAAEQRQYRRVDAYLSPGADTIVMNPGEVAAGMPTVTTLTFHRPIEAYIKAMADAGLMIDALEEWPSRRASQQGPRAKEENRARREIPMFLGIRAVKIERTPPRDSTD